MVSANAHGDGLQLKVEVESKTLQLPLWSELVCTFNGLSANQHFTYIKTSRGLLAFRNGSVETTYVQEKLSKELIGHKIAILRTDIPEKPLVVRLVDRCVRK